MAEPALYLYAFTTSPVTDGPPGIADAPLRTLGRDGVFAVVTDAPQGRLRPQRKHLAAHQNVLTALARRGDILPASFGMVSDAATIEAVLDESRDTLLAELDRVGGCVEMSVRVRWDGGSAFHKLVEADATLRDLRARLVSLGDAAPHDLRVEVGRRVEAVLNALRLDVGRRLDEALAPACREVSHEDPRDEHELANVSCLVPRGELAAFEAAVEAASGDLDDALTLNVSGPFAPHHFVRLELSPGSARGAVA